MNRLLSPKHVLKLGGKWKSEGNYSLDALAAVNWKLGRNWNFSLGCDVKVEPKGYNWAAGGQVNIGIGKPK